MENLSRVDRLFEAFSNTLNSNRHYLFLINRKEKKIRWSQNTVGQFGLKSDVMDAPFTEWIEKVEESKQQDISNLLMSLLEEEKEQFRIIYKVKNSKGEYVSIFFGGHLMHEAKDVVDDKNIYAGVIECLGMVERIDSITNIWTTSVLLEHLEKLREKQQPFTLMLIGVKNFSEINDRYGFAFGDEIIKDISSRLCDIFQDYLVFKGEGVKFYVLAQEIDVGKFERVYNQLQAYSRTMYELKNHHILLEIGGSIVYYNQFDIDIGSIHNVIDLSYRKSKYEKQGELVRCTYEEAKTVSENLQIVSYLRKEIQDESKNFYMVYQPFVDTKEEKICGAETLIRYESSEFGFLPPSKFIPLIESDPVFYKLSLWILQTSLTQTKKIVEKYPDFILNVNLSYAQLQHYDFESILESILETTGFPAKNLCLELTERCRFLDLNFLQERIAYIRSLGIKVALDDFGTGFSSMTLVQNLPIDVIKIDREFVNDIEESFVQQRVVKVISVLAKELDIELTVEGIETFESKEFLNRYTVTSYQGYYYHKPLKIDALMQLMNIE